MDARALAPDRLAGLALALHAIDPQGTGALWIRGRAGPLRDRVLTLIHRGTPHARKIGIEISDEALFGGIDLSQTLSRNVVVRMPGLMERTNALILASAERCPARLGAHLSAATDRGAHSLVLLDEGASSEEQPPESLLERAGLFLSLDGWREGTPVDLPADGDAIARARRLCGTVTITEDQAASLVEAAAGLGIASLRAPLFAIAAARASAALFGRRAVDREDLEYAAALVFGHKATVLPQDMTEPEAESWQDAFGTST